MVRSEILFQSSAITVSDVHCLGQDTGPATAETGDGLRLVVPYRGLFVQHAGGERIVAEPTQVVRFRSRESYRVTHPAGGGDACLVLAFPTGAGRAPAVPAWRARGLPRGAQLAIHTLLADLRAGRGEVREIEQRVATLASALLAGSGPATTRAPSSRALVERTKVVLARDLSRRWALTEIGEAVGVSGVYLTQLFRRIEGASLQRYHLRMRLAAALERLPTRRNLTDLAFELGFSHHSHFTAAFREAYGITPSAFRRRAVAPAA